MGLLKRIGSIFKGQANKAVEKAERADPIGIAKAELQEAKEDLGKLEAGVKQAKGHIIIAEKKIVESQRSADDWKEKAKIAKDGGNMDRAQQAAEKSVEFSDEVERRNAILQTSKVKFEQLFDRFKTKTKDIDLLSTRIKEADINFKTAKALNDIETSETSGAGVNPADRINDMLGMVDEEVAMSEASLDIRTSDDAKLEAEIAKMGSSKKSANLLDSL